MSDLVKEFNAYREKMNDKILGQQHRSLNRFFSLDHQTYKAGALDEKTKEMLGLVASMVLRCDDCIRYHLGQGKQAGMTTEELFDIFAIANLVGGSICVPHTRRALEYWEALERSDR